MTVEEVAAAVDIGKPRLYMQLESKEALVATAVTRLLNPAIEFIRAQPLNARLLDKLRSVVRWALLQHRPGTMPLLPSTHSALRDSPMRNKSFTRSFGHTIADAVETDTPERWDDVAIAKSLWFENPAPSPGYKALTHATLSTRHFRIPTLWRRVSPIGFRARRWSNPPAFSGE